MMLQASKLVAHIEGARVLREVDLDIRAGETVALIGRNGAGKTSLLRSIMGTLPLDEGGLLFQGQNLSKRDAYARCLLYTSDAADE